MAHLKLKIATLLSKLQFKFHLAVTRELCFPYLELRELTN